MTTYLVSTQTGSDSNGGTSIAVRSTGTDGVANAAGGLTTFTSISATWSAADVGHAIRASSGTITRLISAVQVQQTIATAVTASGLTTFTSAGLFNATMLGCAVSGPGIAAGCIISVYTNSSSMTLSIAAGAGFGSGSAIIGPLLTTTGTTNFTAATGQTWNVGGMKLTLNQCLVTASGLPNVLAAGDSIYAGAGTYRETTAVGVSGTAGSAISLIGDVDGAKTGQAGQVILSAYTTSDTSVPSSTVLLALSTHTNLTFSLLTFIGGAASIVTSTAAAAAANYTFTDCTFNALHSVASSALSFVSSSTGLALGVTIDRCVVLHNGVVSTGAVTFSLATTASGAADWDATCIVRNSFIFTPAGEPAVSVVATSANAHLGGGVRVYGCTLLGGLGFKTSTASELSTTIPCEIHNCLTGEISAATAGQITGSFNSIYAGTPELNYTYGTGDVSNSAGTGTYKAPLIELGQSWKWAGVLRQFLAPDGANSPLLGAGSATFTGNYPTVDWANRARPSGGKSASASIGYSEFHDFGIQDTVVFPSGQTSSAKLIGPGDNDIWVPVDATSTVIAIQLNQGSGYTGTTYATATLLGNGELGVAAQVETCSSTLNAWQTLTFSAITPSKAGWVKVRISSFDSSGTGVLNFGALTAT